MRKLLLTLSLTSLTVFSLAHADEKLKADRDGVNQACVSDAKIAGCDGQVVGKGLIKCLHKYKREHKKDFKFSDGCKSSLEKLHSDKKDKK